MIDLLPLEKAHVDELCLLEKATFSDPWSPEAFIQEIENPIAHYIVAQKNGHVVGYAGMWVIIDEAHITNIAVEKTQQRKGIGKKLVEALVKKAEDLNLNALTLEVRESNTAAQNLYKGFGFESAGIRKNYYNHPIEHAVIMWKYLRDG